MLLPIAEAASAGRRGAAEIVAKADKSRNLEAQLHAAADRGRERVRHAHQVTITRRLTMKPVVATTMTRTSYVRETGGFPLSTLHMLAVLMICC
jgi:hypothetical protein